MESFIDLFTDSNTQYLLTTYTNYKVPIEIINNGDYWVAKFENTDFWITIGSTKEVAIKRCEEYGFNTGKTFKVFIPLVIEVKGIEEKEVFEKINNILNMCKQSYNIELKEEVKLA